MADEIKGNTSKSWILSRPLRTTVGLISTTKIFYLFGWVGLHDSSGVDSSTGSDIGLGMVKKIGLSILVAR